MRLTTLTAISPLDGRYSNKLEKLRPLVSEYGLIYYRVFIEVRWLIKLAQNEAIKEATITSKGQTHLEQLLQNFNHTEAEEIKSIEKHTNHDIKAVEYYLRDKLQKHKELKPLIPFIHFACTSEDINNVAYGLMLLHARSQILLPVMGELIDKLKYLARDYARIAMLSRTHGQAATPTTLGKEFMNFSLRLKLQMEKFLNIPIKGKFNGTVGNYNAHLVAYPYIDWPAFNQEFITGLGLSWNSHTTQIEPHDFLAETLQTLVRFNNILIDLNRDIWGYISLNYLKQQSVNQEIGSSTMPHKINPIDFENSEGNLGMANALANHMANKLPISRWQRDLTDSTVLRNLGSVFGYSLIAYQAALAGLNKISANKEQIQLDIVDHWEILAEAIQTILRRYGFADAYEKLKTLTRGKKINKEDLHRFIKDLSLPESTRERLLSLTPENYIGLADELAQEEKKQ